MKTLRAAFIRFRGLFHRRSLEAEMNEELRAHFEALVERHLAAGMSPNDARAAAQREFGGVEQIKESARDERRSAWLESFVRDARYGLRVLARTPGFTTIAIGSLALGLAVNLLMFSLLNAVLFRPLPGTTDPSRIAAVSFDAVPYPEFAFWREHAKSFSGLAATVMAPTAITLAEPERPGAAPAEREPLPQVNFVSGNYFSALGVPMALGRSFAAEEDRVPGRDAVLVLSHWYWQARFGGDPHIVGKIVLLNDTAFTVVGVAAESFLLEPGLWAGPRAWVPLAMLGTLRDPTRERSRWPRDSVHVFGRLQPKVTAGEASEELHGLGADFAREYGRPGEPALRFHVYSGFTFMPWERPEMKIGLLALLFGASVVLLVACANVACLQIARATTRQREISVRLAMGASRARIVRQLLTESVLLAGAGGALGLLIAALASKPLWPRVLGLNLTPAQLDLFGVDARMALYTTLLAVVTGVMFGLMPALEASKSSISSALKQETQLGGARVSRSRLRGLLVSGQVAVATTLLIIATLALRSGFQSDGQRTDFETEHLFWLNCFSADANGASGRPLLELERELLTRIRALPGVKAATFSNGWWTHGFARDEATIDGQPWHTRLPGKGSAAVTTVSPQFFATVGLPLVSGRLFTDDEARGGVRVYVVGEAFARKLWPNESAVGHRLKLNREPEGEIVGVVKDGVQALQSRWERIMAFTGFVGEIYEPLPDSPSRAPDIWVRTEIDPALIMRVLGREAQAVDKSLFVTARGTVAESVAGFRRMLMVVSIVVVVVGVLVLGLALTGVYGVTAYAVAQRTHEIGVRMAMGAHPRDIVRLILWEGTRLVVRGLAVGAVSCAVLATVLRSLLDGLSPVDPVTFVGVALLLGVTALVACWFPAIQAARVDPLVALRAE